MSKSGGVFQFSGGRMTSRRQCPRGGGGACEIPPLQEILYPRACYLCKILGNQPLRPPNQSVPIRLCLDLYALSHSCIICPVSRLHLHVGLMSRLSPKLPALQKLEIPGGQLPPLPPPQATALINTCRIKISLGTFSVISVRN